MGPEASISDMLLSDLKESEDPMTLPPKPQAMTERNYPQDWTETDTHAVDTARAVSYTHLTLPTTPYV